jgi:beta-carotene 15,15'-dioxygenase
MNKIYKLSIILSFLGLWLVSFLTSNYQTILGFILIFSFGIFHGTNDLTLIRKITSNQNKSFWYVLLSYVICVLVGVVIFYLTPVFSLILFITVSAFHFGEQHWEKTSFQAPKWVLVFYTYIYGQFIFSMLFYFHQNEVTTIIKQITNVILPQNFYKLLLLTNSIILIIMTFIMYFRSKQFKEQIVVQLFYILVLSIIFSQATLICGFSFYFILWHSLPSIFSQIEFLYGGFSKQTIFKYLKEGYIYWIVSMFGLVIFYSFFNTYKFFDAIFFSFLASITFPHVTVIFRMFQKNKIS